MTRIRNTVLQLGFFHAKFEDMVHYESLRKIPKLILYNFLWRNSALNE